MLYDGRILSSEIESNAVFLERLAVWAGREGVHRPEAVVFEKIESFGMAVGAETFETVFWTGRLYGPASVLCGRAAERMPRRTVKLHICHSARATDANIRMALLDRWGGTGAAIGSKKTPGPLYGVKSHLWAALALAVTFSDQANS